MDIDSVGMTFTAFLPRQQKSADSTPQAQAFSGEFHPIDGTASAASSRAIQTQSARTEDSSERKEAEPEELDKAVEKVQKFVSMTACDIEFSIDEDSGHTVVKVIDRETKDVIRQIPSQEMLDLAQALDKLQGLLIRQKA